MQKIEQNYVIFTDSDTDMTPNIAKKYGYNLISMPYSINGTEIMPYIDFKEFDAHNFYEGLRHGVMPTTSALSPVDYENYFEPFFKAGKDILYVHFSKAMSGTFNAMSLALNKLKSSYPERKFYAIDTKAIALGAYNILLEVGDMYIEGKSVEEIVEWAEKEVDKFATYLFVNDLSFFKRSGRVKAIAAFFGNLLGIRPIISMDSDGLMTPKFKARGLTATINKLIETVVDLADDIKLHRVIIGHSDCLETAKVLEHRLKDEFGDDLKTEIVDVNPTAGCHCGPDGVGISFHAKHR